VAANRSRVVFHGGIHIREGADGTDANLSNKNLLLSADAEIDTQPTLVIDADEVKAAHGATVGQLDANALFYLRSRGLPPNRRAHAERRVLPRAAGGLRRTAPSWPPPGQGAARRAWHEPVHPASDPEPAPDWERVRADFPLLMREVHGKPLVYFDNANTAQKPVPVIGAVDEFYRRYNANVSRAVHALGTEATDAYEGARTKLARFLNVRAATWCCAAAPPSPSTWWPTRGRCRGLKAGDVILVSRMEHHANIVPWQLVAERTGAHPRGRDHPDGSSTWMRCTRR
jgi:hypothetical protein